MKIKLFFIINLLTINLILSQTLINITEQTIKIKALSEEILYFGFEEGDQIIFNVSEINGKEVKEVEIVEFPSSSKFSDFKTSKIENKTINVNSKGVYKFRFYNSSLGGRICKIKIQRIPTNESLKDFNTNVKWVTEQDTTWNSYTKDVIVRYDTLKIKKTRKVIESEEKTEEMIFDKSQRVHSKTNSNGNKTSLFFVLPQNRVSEYETKRVVAWAYWIGVGEESNKAWQQNRKLIVGAVQTGSKLTFSPLGALAVGTVTNLVLPTIGHDVSYGIVDEVNKNLFFSGAQYKGYDFGKGIAGYKKFDNIGMMQGVYHIVLYNDNDFQGIDVNIKVSTVIEHVKYRDEEFIDLQVNPVYEKQIFNEPIITTRKFPVTFDYKKQSL
ncbi:hypothetical protein SY27_04015 [Flavobacterium sp. 316]|uniref:hypothetical protein n=1 Tax=Flavobacterium sp. 316 TaxID=1603293 RepID=UPI0005E82428|nr:hypothetical protein [Flavobacterium sp. 316]KIX21857.1 hypothetical protein SY27_04015 [Flavobacterium sp. 316]